MSGLYGQILVLKCMGPEIRSLEYLQKPFKSSDLIRVMQNAEGQDISTLALQIKALESNLDNQSRNLE